MNPSQPSKALLTVADKNTNPPPQRPLSSQKSLPKRTKLFQIGRIEDFNLLFKRSPKLLRHVIIIRDLHRTAFKVLPQVTFQGTLPEELKLRSYYSLLKHFRSLKSLTILLQLSISTKHPHDRTLIHTLNSYKSLDSLNLEVYIHKEITKPEASKFTTCLEKLNHLSKLQLIVKSSSQNSEDISYLNLFFKNLSRRIRRMKNLCEIGFSLPWVSGLSEQNIDELLTGIGKLKLLNSLKIRIVGCESIGSRTMKKLRTTLSQLKFLSSFQVMFGYAEEITIEDFTNFCKTLETDLKELLDLDLGFTKNQGVKAETINLLAGALSQMKKLRSLKLDFSRCSGVDSQGLGALGHMLRYKEGLQSLELNFSSCPLDNSNVTTFCLFHLPNLSFITSIGLNFSGCEQVNPGEIIQLLKQMGCKNVTFCHGATKVNLKLDCMPKDS